MIAIITTKYRGPTDARGSRILAKADINPGVYRTTVFKARASLPWDHRWSNEDNHKQAAMAAVAKAGFAGDGYEVAGFRDDDGIGHWVATIKGDAR
jgi:hypothetical protein